MKTRLTLLAAVLVSLVPADQAAAQIELRDSYRVHEPIEVKVAGDPAVVLWKLPVALGSVSQDNGKRLYIWSPAGRHILSVTCLSIDWDARKVSATEHSAVLVVEGIAPIPPGPTPDPTPPPPVPVPTAGKRTVILIRETGDATPAIAAMVAQLRAGEPSKYLASKQHPLGIYDDELVPALKAGQPNLAQWLSRFDGNTLPFLIVADPANTAASGVLFADKAPNTAAEVLEILKRHGG